MKTKVIIENGETDIILTPENDFDKGVLEKIHKNKQNFYKLTFFLLFSVICSHS